MTTPRSDSDVYRDLDDSTAVYTDIARSRTVRKTLAVTPAERKPLPLGCWNSRVSPSLAD